MRIAIHAIGRMKQGPERELVTRYLDRAKASGKPFGFTGFDVSELPESRANNAPNRKSEEGSALHDAIGEDALVVALDERGKSLTSPAFADTLARWRGEGHRDVAFVIGGADGLDPLFLQTADLTLSFSPLTWPHQLVRIMLAEQLYRATTILSGHPYHRGD
jgi:23S rRNA (pseudouridine1915-N3)-methyltransferase